MCVPAELKIRSFVRPSTFASASAILLVASIAIEAAGNSVQGQLGFESCASYTKSAPFFQASFKDSCQGFQDNGSARGQMMHAVPALQRLTADLRTGKITTTKKYAKEQHFNLCQQHSSIRQLVILRSNRAILRSKLAFLVVKLALV